MIEKSDIVKSLNGRDTGKYFFVLNVDDGYAMLADGKGRRVELPKKKKLKHVQLAAKTPMRTAEKIRNNEKITNSDLRRALAEFAAGANEDRGGM